MSYPDFSSRELVLACAFGGEAEAWEEFVRRFHRLVAVVALRTARRWGETSPEVVADLVQDTYLKLCADDCRILRAFDAYHDEAIYGFLKVVTANVVHDHFKAARTEKRGGGLPGFETPALDPTSNRNVAASIPEHGILLGEVDDCLRTLVAGPHADRDRRIFWLYYRVGLTAKAIAELPSIGLGTKGVESTILRLTRGVRERMSGSPVKSENSRDAGIGRAGSLFIGDGG